MIIKIYGANIILAVENSDAYLIRIQFLPNEAISIICILRRHNP